MSERADRNSWNPTLHVATEDSYELLEPEKSYGQTEFASYSSGKKQNYIAPNFASPCDTLWHTVNQCDSRE
jgi:hypothetical protein